MKPTSSSTPTAAEIAAETQALFPTPEGREGFAEALTEFAQLKVGEQLGYLAWLQAQAVRQLGALDGRLEALGGMLAQQDGRRGKAGEEAVKELRREVRRVRQAVEDAADGEEDEDPALDASGDEDVPGAERTPRGEAAASGASAEPSNPPTTKAGPADGAPRGASSPSHPGPAADTGSAPASSATAPSARKAPGTPRSNGTPSSARSSGASSSVSQVPSGVKRNDKAGKPKEDAASPPSSSPPTAEAEGATP